MRIAEVNLGEILKAKVTERLREFGIKTTIAAKNIGYELRCADPIPFDMEYTRDLGYCAAKYLARRRQCGDDLDAGRPLRAGAVHRDDRRQDRPHARSAWSTSTSTRYAIARRYMIRLRRDDFEDPHEVARLATVAKLTEQEFRREFEYLVAAEPPPLQMDEQGERAQTAR